MDIYDFDKGKWYKINRGLFGLKLESITYDKIYRAPVNGDLIYSPNGQLYVRNNPEPKTPSLKRKLEPAEQPKPTIKP